ncbi:MAG TPA: hypothetical protein H9915_11020 [Candidatus Gemmiger faecigallinarum]|nr:hypothetical protein [Candidatus Gemmiger faecigallinarum]
MTASPPLWAVWTDVLWCLGLGLALGAVRDAAGLLFGESRPVRFVLDLAAFGLAAVLACGFAAGLSASGAVRWYMAAAMALGALGWRWAASGALHRLTAGLLRLLAAPLRLAGRLLQPAKRRFAAALERRAEQSAEKRQKGQKKRKKILQKPKRILYN